MKSINSLNETDAALPITADTIREFHAARILLLLKYCGDENGEIDSLTKMAKMDFFVRYPKFYNAVRTNVENLNNIKQTESQMIRFHYGPWDQRYYDVFAYLKSKGLITITIDGRKNKLALTSLGNEATNSLTNSNAFTTLILQMKAVHKSFGTWNGTKIKNYIYKRFSEEIGKLKLGQGIK